MSRVATVLVVEDDDIIRRLLEAQLEQLGYRVVVVADGDEALAAHGGRHVDALVTDIGLPGMDGQALAKRLQALQPGLPVLFLSGSVAVSSAAGNVGYLHKPFNSEDLSRALRTVLDAPATGR